MIYDEQGQLTDVEIARFVRDITVSVGNYVMELLKTEKATLLEIEALANYIQREIGTGIGMTKLTYLLEAANDNGS